VVSGILLAAGASRRFGGHKLLADVDGAPLIRRTAERLLAATLDEVIVVLGREPERVRATLAGLSVRFTTNDRWSEGLSGSLAAGVRALDPRAAVVVVALGDQPTIDPTVIDALVEVAQRERAAITLPAYRGTRGHPVVFARELFPELLAVTGDRGARDVVALAPERVREVAIDADAPRDVDTADDLEEVRRLVE
jgi:molybdenum cofactor cytidylyltransferase